MVDALDAASLASEARYSRVAMWLHWTIAALIVANLLLGFLNEDFGKPAEAAMMMFHKSFGLSVLILSVGRLLWRVGHRPPAFAATMPRWEVWSARAGHWLFYVLMIALPLTGWLMSSAGGPPSSFFGLFPIPRLPIAHGRDVHEFWEEGHELLAFAMIGLLAIHIAGALKHVMQGHGEMIARMAPWLYPAR